MYNVVDSYCIKSKNVYNQANYLIRQEFINNGKWIRYRDMDKLMQQTDCYYDLGSQASQQTLRLLDKNWKSFFMSIKDWSKNPKKYLGRPKLPNYKDKEKGRFILMLKNIQCRVEDGFLRFSWKPFREFTIPTKVSGRLLQVRFVPRGKNYIMEIVYEETLQTPLHKQNRIAAIDIGINNLATVSNNVDSKSFILNGKPLKSMNHYYNKKKATIQSHLKKKHNKNWSNNLEKLTFKRYNKIKYYMHNSSKYIVSWCVKNEIDTLIVGKNDTWKQEVRLGSRNNQNFTQIPFDMFINQLKYKCENVGINFIVTEESYTSGTSFIDNEHPTKENYDKSRRVTRGLFRSNNGVLINADLNGSYQIMRKAIPEAFVDGIQGADLHPIRVNVI